MLKQLENYYCDEGIFSADFRCKHLSECRGGAANFTEAKSAFVGEQYGAAGLPRLLFVSLDPGSTKTDKTPDGEVLITFVPPENRTPAAVRRLVMRRAQFVREQKIVRVVKKGIVKDRKISNSPRLRGTNELAMRILSAFNPAFSENVELTMQHYAHANAAKCCQNKNGREQADGKMFRRCRGYLRGEIAVFKHDILITHGGDAKKGIQFSLGKKRREKPGKEVAPNAFICETSDGAFFWMHTPHPSARYPGGGKPKPFLAWKSGEDGGPGLAGYVELIRAFMEERTRA